MSRWDASLLMKLSSHYPRQTLGSRALPPEDIWALKVFVINGHTGDARGCKFLTGHNGSGLTPAIFRQCTRGPHIITADTSAPNRFNE